jgi:hypothetical protein
MPSTAAARTGVTVRLDPEDLDRLRRIAEEEHRSVAGYLELLVERDLAAREEAERVVYIHVAPELAGLPQGPIGREDGESDERYERRKAVLTALFGES